jgi:hypothetical protein
MTDVLKTSQDFQRITYTIPSFTLRNMVIAALTEDVGQVFNASTTCSLKSDGSMTVATDYPAMTKP